MTLPADHVLTAIAHQRRAWDVLAFIGSLNVGGCERHLATVYPRLAAAGLRVGIVTFRRGGPLEEEVRASGRRGFVPRPRAPPHNYFRCGRQPSSMGMSHSSPS